MQAIELGLPAGGRLGGRGNGPIAAAVAALGLPLRIDSCAEHALGTGADASGPQLLEAARSGTAGALLGRHPYEHNHGLDPGS
ncbi:MAG: hypothetical protein ACYDAE_20565 [Steroidobacteraceae bacterium]